MRPVMVKLAQLGKLNHQCAASQQAAVALANQSADFYQGLLVGCNLFEQATKELPVLVQVALIEEIHHAMHAQIYAMQQLDALSDAEFPDSILL